MIAIFLVNFNMYSYRLLLYLVLNIHVEVVSLCGLCRTFLSATLVSLLLMPVMDLRS